MGITVGLDPVPSITLGVEEVPVMDMAAAFGTLANDGIHCEAWAVRRVERISGPADERLLYRHRSQCEQTIDAKIAHLVTAMLERVVCCGTGRAALIPGRPVAGKTGTAQDYTNVYFAGYTPQVATAVWVGFPSGNIPMDTYFGSSVFGGTVAAPIWQDFMEKALDGYRVEGFEAPPPPETGAIPNVVGLPVGEAEAILVEANFTPVREEVDSFQEEGLVVSQAPKGGTAQLGTAVKIGVSNSKGEPVTVPRVVGLTEEQAIKALEKAGLIARVEPFLVSEKKQVGIVISQVPLGSGDKLVDAGATVKIFVGATGDEGGGNGDGGGGDGGGNGNGSGEPAALPRRHS